jgi:tetratricopeptide (TPR) repeat protein
MISPKAGSMSRFINLEFGGEAEDQSHGETHGLARDEHYYFQEARSAFERGDFEKALRNYGKVLEFNPQNAAAWTAQVRMLIELGQLRDANSWADKALESFPSESELLAAKAVALARNGDTNGALAFSDASVEEHAGSAYIWLARGDVLLALKEGRADYCVEKSLHLAPGDWVILWLAARVRFYHEQFAAALQLAQLGIGCDAGHVVLWLEQGRCQESLGLMEAAQDSFARALELDRDCHIATEALVRLRSHGLADVARGWWRRMKQ